MKIKVNQQELTLGPLERDGGRVSFELKGTRYSYELVYRLREKFILRDDKGRLRQIWFKKKVQGECFVSVGTESFQFSPLQTSRRKEAALDSGSMVSPMPGKIFKVLASPGQKVKKGETILILEAMKMEHAIKASNDGVVKKIMFEAGDLVGGGVILAVVEEQE